MTPETLESQADGPRHVAVAAPMVDASVIREAAEATEAEHNMGLIQSFKLYKKACLWSIFLSTCLIMEGFDIVLLNNLYAQKPFQRQFGVEQSDGSYQLTAAWQAGLSNGALVGEIFGLFISGIIAHRIGYRKTLIGALFGCICFTFIIFFSHTTTTLLIGEILIGVPWGAFQALTTTYASEVCPVSLRAYLTTYVNACWVIGQFIASGVLRAMVTRDDQWAYRIPFALQWVWPVPLIVGIWLAPESPWWLVRCGRLEDAKKSLIRLTDRKGEESFNIDSTISMMIHTNEMEKEVMAGTSYWDLFRGTNLRRTEIVCAVWAIQTLCGSNFMGYSTVFYLQAGLSRENSFSMSLAQYAIGLIGTILSWFLMLRLGRRTLYLYGQMALVALLLIIGCVSFSAHDNNAAKWAIGSALLVFTFVYDSSVGPVCYSLVSELPSTRLRAKSVVLARNTYNIISIVGNILTPNQLNPTAWNWGAKAGFFWAGSAALCVLWTYFRLPEPKGRTYGELDILFEKKISARKFKSTVVDRLDATSSSVSINEKGAGAVMIERVGTQEAHT